MPSLRAKVSKTSGQGLTRGAYKTANKLGMKGHVDTGLKKFRPRKGKLDSDVTTKHRKAA